MKDVYLVSCTKSKLDREAEAQNIYTSTLFEKASGVAERESDEWYVLSAKHGLLEKTQVIEPYDKTLHNFNRSEREEWAKKVHRELQQVLTSDDVVTLFAGEAYREFLVPKLEADGVAVSVPMEGKSIGHQLSWLNKRQEVLDRREHLDQFYELLDRLAEGAIGPIRLSETDGYLDWPDRGVYFVFEPGEYRDSEERKRVVRVGTHAVSSGSGATLWNRLRTHRGTEAGSGNHRSSIFRLHLGEALMERDGFSVPTWANETVPDQIPTAEANLEETVTERLGEMEVICVEIDDEPGPDSDRAYVEQQAIALLSGYQEPADKPGDDWLGHHSTRESIRKSGLWNVDHVEEEYDPQFIDVFERYVDATIGDAEQPAERLGPRTDQSQTTLEQY